ncbi:hypothetical protein [Methylomonas sp. HYX-M1]|uniref:hypothetical protein n=1 Tax=Methylomonas sp. HYX-M1 TaxID=3139307 RepID=UPI00345BCF94
MKLNNEKEIKIRRNARWLLRLMALCMIFTFPTLTSGEEVLKVCDKKEIDYLIKEMVKIKNVLLERTEEICLEKNKENKYNCGNRFCTYGDIKNNLYNCGKVQEERDLIANQVVKKYLSIGCEKEGLLKNIKDLGFDISMHKSHFSYPSSIKLNYPYFYATIALREHWWTWSSLVLEIQVWHELDRVKFINATIFEPYL